jgi:hypothetical protein
VRVQDDQGEETVGGRRLEMDVGYWRETKCATGSVVEDVDEEKRAVLKTRDQLVKTLKMKRSRERKNLWPCEDQDRRMRRCPRSTSGEEMSGKR